MRKIDVLLEAYDADYQTGLSRTVQYLCVPVLLFGFLGLVYAIPVYRLFTSIFEPSVTKHINLASVLVVVVSLYYLSLSAKLAAGMFTLFLLALAAIHIIELNQLGPLWLVMAIVFVIASIGQVVSHRQTDKPLSFRTFIHWLIIGPLWVLRKVYRCFGIRV